MEQHADAARECTFNIGLLSADHGHFGPATESRAMGREFASEVGRHREEGTRDRREIHIVHIEELVEQLLRGIADFFRRVDRNRNRPAQRADLRECQGTRQCVTDWKQR